MNLDLSPEDQTLLIRVLTEYLSNLRMEIVDTESRDWRADLKAKEDQLRAVLTRLGATIPAPTPPPTR
ncbi:MAG: hypothetical protein ACRDGF_10115 [Chloroflexota bacterium]